MWNDLLDDSIEIPEHVFGHVYGFFILAQYRETRAYPLLLKALTLPLIHLDHFRTIAAHKFPSLIASVYDGSHELIYDLIEDEVTSQ